MSRVIFTKAHVGAYMRSGRLVNLAGYQGRGARAVATPGQMALFAPGDTPPSKNPFKGKHPVLDTPDLFTGKTPREMAPPAPAPKPHPLAASAERLAGHRQALATAEARGDTTSIGFLRDLVIPSHEREHSAMQAAFDAYHKHGDGTELSDKEGRRHIVLLPDASNPGKYRYQTFDSQGFSSHSTHDTPEQAVADAAEQGYTVSNPGILDKLAGTDEWAHGMAINAVMQAHNSGQIDWQTAMDKIKVLHDAREAAKAPQHSEADVSRAKEIAKTAIDGISKSAGGDKKQAIENLRDAAAKFREAAKGIGKTDSHVETHWNIAAGLVEDEAGRQEGALNTPRHPSSPSKSLLNMVPEERRAEWGELHRQQHELHHYELGQSKERLERARKPMRRAESAMREAEAAAKMARSGGDLPGTDERVRDADAAVHRHRQEFEKHRAKVDGEAAMHQTLYERVAKLGRQKEKIASATGDMDIDWASMKKRTPDEQMRHEKAMLGAYRDHYKAVAKPMRKAWDWLGTEPMHKEPAVKTLFLKSYVKPYVKKDGTVVDAHNTKQSASAADSFEKAKMLAHERATASVIRKYGTTNGREPEEHYRNLYTGHLENLTGKKV